MVVLSSQPGEVGQFIPLFTRFEHHPTGGWPWDFRTINSTTSWWFQIFHIFTPNLGEDEPNLTHIFQRGWFNHQLDYEIGPSHGLHRDQNKFAIFFENAWGGV